MEYIRGSTLTEYAEKNRLGARDKLEIMAKVAEAVQHAHQRGLIHRDLKPGNILVDETGQPKIVDFGVARVTDSDARTTQQTTNPTARSLHESRAGAGRPAGDRHERCYASCCSINFWPGGFPA
jgi:serine/threonine protein kinase